MIVIYFCLFYIFLLTTVTVSVYVLVFIKDLHYIVIVIPKCKIRKSRVHLIMQNGSLQNLKIESVIKAGCDG